MLDSLFESFGKIFSPDRAEVRQISNEMKEEAKHAELKAEMYGQLDMLAAYIVNSDLEAPQTTFDPAYFDMSGISYSPYFENEEDRIVVSVEEIPEERDHFDYTPATHKVTGVVVPLIHEIFTPEGERVLLSEKDRKDLTDYLESELNLWLLD